MRYPAIVYKRDSEDAKYANNKKYRRTVMYQITVIDRDPDSEIVKKVTELPMCFYSSNFAYDGLNHDIFRMYF